jgi:GNAT superfamily N-acetyltransferase
VLIREATIEDVPQNDLLRQAVYPWHAASLETQRIWFTQAPPDALRLRAEVDGRIVGLLDAGLQLHTSEPGIVTATLHTHPDSRRQGVGSALYERLEAYLAGVGARRVQAWALDEPASVGWAQARGFTASAAEQFQVVDPRVLPPIPAVPPGITVATAAEAGPEVFFSVEDVASRDEPGDVPFEGMPYPDWFDRHWGTVDHDVSMICFVDGVPAATTALTTNRSTGRAMSSGSDALREFRGRGLIKYLKSVSLRRAADAGITAAFTCNDDTNAPMLAINRWLGYRPVAASRSMVKTLG